MRVLNLLLTIPWIALAQSGVGINTDNPQQALHIAGATSTLRHQGVSHFDANNPGDFNNNNDLTDDTVPIYVDSEGVFKLGFNTFSISEADDAIESSTTVTLNIIANPNGNRVEEIYSREITTFRPTIVEIEYNISFEVYRNIQENPIRDFFSRRITNFFTVEGSTRTYGIASKNYTNFATNSLLESSGDSGTYYNVGRAFIELPEADTYTIIFFGEVDSGDEYEPTSVKFGSAVDALLIRLY